MNIFSQINSPRFSQLWPQVINTIERWQTKAVIYRLVGISMLWKVSVPVRVQHDSQSHVSTFLQLPYRYSPVKWLQKIPPCLLLMHILRMTLAQVFITSSPFFTLPISLVATKSSKLLDTLPMPHPLAPPAESMQPHGKKIRKHPNTEDVQDAAANDEIC